MTITGEHVKEDDTPSWLDYLKAWPQYLLPGHLVSRVLHVIARIRAPAFKNRLITWFAGHYRVDLSEAVEPEPRNYEHFNAFFTRALRPGARTVAEGERVIACPVDGTVSQIGTIRAGHLFQAKGHSYSLEQLLGGSAQRAELFDEGLFATVYLSPRDYHRIHMPLDGRLREMVHVPGRLFSVNPATTRVIPGLFARNERVVTLFDTALGPMAMVLVGAVNVGSIETVWSGVVTPPAGRIVRQWRYDREDASPIELRKGEEMGRFNMGSTVILVLPSGSPGWAGDLTPGTTVRMGQQLGAGASASDKVL